MEEDLRPQEALVPDINREGLVVDGILAFVLLDPLGLVAVVLVELLGDVGTDVAEPLYVKKRKRAET